MRGQKVNFIVGTRQPSVLRQFRRFVRVPILEAFAPIGQLTTQSRERPEIEWRWRFLCKQRLFHNLAFFRIRDELPAWLCCVLYIS